MPKATNGHKTKLETATPLPPIPEGFKRIRLYPPVWRGEPGDVIKGNVICVEPIELPDGTDCNATMVRLAAPCPVLRYSARGEGIDDGDNGGKPAPLGHEHEIVALPAYKLGSIGRLMTYGDQPELSQLIEVHAIGRNGRTYYECFIARVPSQRADVDPRVQAAMAEAVRSAQRATT